MKDPAGKPAPQGGFQTGGWYSGYQYWNGTFASQAGQIHPASNQPGAGQTVSEEVNNQGDVAQGLAPGTNQAYINQQNSQPAVNPSVQAQPSTPASSSSSTPGTDTSMTPSLDTPDFVSAYKGLNESSGVTKLQDDYLEKERQFIEAKGKINDNPFLSEATRVGREAKLTKLFNERTASLQNEIAMKKADNEMMLNLQMKQYQIDSEANQQNISNLSNLINIGAFDNASGESIAAWTRKTGISSDIIQSAITARTKKDIETQVITSTADSGEVTVSVVNKLTGEIINQNSLGKIGNAQTGSGLSTTEETQMIKQDIISDARKGKTWDDIYRDGIVYITDVEELYGLYLAGGYYKVTDKQKKDDINRYSNKDSNISTITYK